MVVIIILYHLKFCPGYVPSNFRALKHRIYSGCAIRLLLLHYARSGPFIIPYETKPHLIGTCPYIYNIEVVRIVCNKLCQYSRIVLLACVAWQVSARAQDEGEARAAPSRGLLKRGLNKKQTTTTTTPAPQVCHFSD